MAVTHAFVSAKSDGGDATVVRPTDWNASHTIAGTLAWDGATVTVDTPLISGTQTWNNSGVTFTGWKLNITNTASASGSMLLDLQVGGSSVLNVQNLTTPRIVGAGNATIELASSGAVWLGASPGTKSVGFQPYSNFGFALGSTYALGWNTTTDASSGLPDTNLYRDAAATLAQRNDTTAQTFRVYNTYTNASNYERGVFDWTTTSNTLVIGAQAAGSGTIRDVQFVGSGKFTFVSPGSSVTPTNNGDLVIQATSNTSLTFKYKGSDGTVRSASLTLA